LPLGLPDEDAFVRVDQRRDGRAFGAADLRLMGAMADFFSSLYSQAKQRWQMGEQNKVLQFLIDQLPLGVLCFDANGGLISANASAWQMLGVATGASAGEQAAVTADFLSGIGSGEESHFEIEGRLMFAVRRSFEVAAGASVSAFVIYDMSTRREKLFDALDREYYKARCEDGGIGRAHV